MSSDEVFAVPGISGDSRVHVFRCKVNEIEGFEGLEVDAYAIVTSHYLIILDTFLCPEDAAAMMGMVKQELPGRQLLVVNSHADWDHAWGNVFFRDTYTAPIIAHTQGRVRAFSQKERDELANFQANYPLFKNVQLIAPTITFEESMTIHGGDLTIELFSAPGHYSDHIAAWIPELQLLLAFDAVERPIPCLENSSSVPQMFATLERLVKLQPKHVLCSHGKTTSPEIVSENLNYFRTIEKKCRTFLQEHRPTQAELEHGSQLINFSFDEVIASITEPVDRTYYSWVHEQNIQAMFDWLMS